MATTSTNFVAALGTGSGIDIKALAQSLVDAEKAPKEALIKGSIEKSEARISGYSTVLYAVEQVKIALDALRDRSAFDSITPVSSNAQAVAVVESGGGAVGGHEVEVSQLAQSQRVVSTRLFAASDSVAPVPYTIRLTLNDAAASSRDVLVSDASPAGLVSAINGANFGGITASLLDSGSGASPLRVVINGAQGERNGFSITDVGSSSLVGTGLATTVDTPSAFNRGALDASLLVNGLPVRRPSNRVSDVIQGVTLELLKTTSGSVVPADRVVNIAVTRDTAPVKEKIKQVVTTYNDLQAILDAALDKESKVENLGGTLTGDSTIKAIRAQVQRILMPESGAVADPTAPLTDLRQLGLFVDVDRRLKFASISSTGSNFSTTFQVGSEQTLDKALAARFEDLATMFAGPSGIASVMSDRLSGSGAYLDSSVRPSSPMRVLKVQAGNFTERVTQDNDRLAALRDRMDQLLTRYTKQFSIMESLVGESKSVRSSVENSFKAMSGGRG